MSELVIAGSELMLLGMGIVFVFLSLLVITLHGMSAFALRISGETVTTSTLPLHQVAASQTAAPVAVISAAVTHYRATRRT